jgi:hypothetical protein
MTSGRSNKSKWTNRFLVLGMCAGFVYALYAAKTNILLGYGWSDTYFWHLLSRDWNRVLFIIILTPIVGGVVGMVPGLSLDWLSNRRSNTPPR